MRKPLVHSAAAFACLFCLWIALAVHQASADDQTPAPDTSSPSPTASPYPTAPSVYPDDGSCSVDGDGGDTLLNDQKNRFVGPQPGDMNVNVHSVDDIVSLPAPPDVQGQTRDTWSMADSTQIAAIESTGAVVTGYLSDPPKQENTGSGESCNCHQPQTLFDYHIYVSSAPGVGKKDSVVVEMTPRWRSVMTTWQDFNKLLEIQQNRYPVRVTGWLLFDEDHLDQVGIYRATVWEVHPVTKFEYQTPDGAWNTL